MARLGKAKGGKIKKSVRKLDTPARIRQNTSKKVRVVKRGTT
tara:strand:- start:751 stop:876 length:126 start_codon:yes stop_codon:yes gene_type:complete